MHRAAAQRSRRCVKNDVVISIFSPQCKWRAFFDRGLAWRTSHRAWLTIVIMTKKPAIFSSSFHEYQVILLATASAVIRATAN